MELELGGRLAVVVGAASGIGLAIADGFAAAKANVALLDLAEHVPEKAGSVGDAHGVQTQGFVVDVRDYDGLCHVAEDVRAKLGPVDHLVYAVGLPSGKAGFPFWNLEPGDWPRVLDVNLLGAVNTAHAFLADFVERRKGTWLFISSIAGQIGSQTDPPYSAAKAGLINFAQCAAKDLAPYNVRVNALCPGMVRTSLNRGVWEGMMKNVPPEERQDYDTWAEAKIQQAVPLGRWQTPQEMADMAVFLASARANSVTGQTINVDGGFVMHR